MKTRNINEGSGGFKVTAEKYEPVRKALLRSVPKTQKGATFSEVAKKVGAQLDPALFVKPGSVNWYTKVVQLDLEAHGLVERVPGSVPMRLRRA